MAKPPQPTTAAEPGPATRTLLRATVEDAATAADVFDTLMGEQVPPRKKFIQTHAKCVRNLDI